MESGKIFEGVLILCGPSLWPEEVQEARGAFRICCTLANFENISCSFSRTATWFDVTLRKFTGTRFVAFQSFGAKYFAPSFL